MRLILLASAVFGLVSIGFGQAASATAEPATAHDARRVPGQSWMRFAAPEDAGFSSEALAEVREAWGATQSAGYMVVHQGAVVAAWGDLERRFMCHSVRKSFLSGLIGTEVDAGRLDLDRTMAQLEINDDGVDGPGLTPTEASATVHDLLRARSGVYRLAAYEPPQNPKPERGAYGPNEFWCYNNWDFNTLLTVFEGESGTKVFEAFGQRFAAPLGMEDYRPRDGYYHYELDKSQHPAYPFRMSGRDMARYGLLYLNRGLWGGERILSEAWVEASAQSHSEGVWGGGGYGYMWWVSGVPELAELGAYSARGVGGQFIQVIPGADLVIVNRTNTFEGHSVGQDPLEALSLAVLRAKTGEADPKAELVPLERQRQPERVALPDYVVPRLLRQWDAWDGVVIKRANDARTGQQLILESRELPGMSFDVVPVTETTFKLEGMELGFAIELGPDAKGDELLSESDLNLAGYTELGAGHVEAALAIFERNAALFPWSGNIWDSLGEGRLAAGDLEGSIEAYGRSLELNPHNGNATEAIERIETQLGSSGR